MGTGRAAHPGPRLVALCAALALALLATPRAMRAQDGTGRVVGTVRDSAGVASPGVTVAAVRDDGSAARRASTDATGAYRILLLRPGRYTITVPPTGGTTCADVNTRRGAMT